MPQLERVVFTVTEINSAVRELVEEAFPTVCVTGEVSNFKPHASGHLYFTLKDLTGQLRTVCFRGTARNIRVSVEDGAQLIVTGRLTVYENYGQYQLVADAIEAAGAGSLEKAYRVLVEKLRVEGLFDTERKRALPRYPRCVAVVTSPTGAAIRDVLSTLERRWPCARVLVVPVRVQGVLAAPEIEKALDQLSRATGIDVVIVGRGGGSLEDLWAFNEELVARAIARCSIPVISAVGHESDITIADLVADARAATPTMAAEIAVPVRTDVLRAVDVAAERMERALRASLEQRRQRLTAMIDSYALGSVRGRVERAQVGVDRLSDRAAAAMRARLHRPAIRLESLTGTLTALNPRAVLLRGYAICTEPETGRVVRAAAGAHAGEDLDIAFHDGSVRTVVKGAST